MGKDRKMKGGKNKEIVKTGIREEKRGWKAMGRKLEKIKTEYKQMGKNYRDRN